MGVVIVSVTPDSIAVGPGGTIPIPILGMGVEDITKHVTLIRRELHAAILRGFKRAVAALEVMAKKIVPESKYRTPSYPPSYKSEKMMETYLDNLKSALSRLEIKATLQSEYELQEEWSASYTKYVNEMVGVDWSKEGSVGGFVEILHNLLEQLVERYVADEIANAETLGINALKYIGGAT
jgi:hypothetical protein